MKIAIIINLQRLTPALEEQLKSQELSSKYNITYDLFLPDYGELDDILMKVKSQSYNAYIIGGGDGTVRTAAEILLGTRAVFCILPLGTFNLLAKALGHPNDLDQIFAMIKNGKTKQIDLIEVNKKIVINHAWIGFYTAILKARKKHRAIVGKSKFLKIVFNALNLFQPLVFYNLELKVDNVETKYETCLVYIGNNEYGSDLMNLNERKTLSSGLLSVTVLNCKTRTQLFLCLLRMLFFNIKNSSYIMQFSTDELIISAKSNLINIVLDGDLFKLDTPLHFLSRHKVLTVAVP